MRKLLLLMLVLGLAVGCSSSDKEVEDRELEERENDDIEREYVVRDASSNIRPGWIEDAEIWAKQQNKDTETYRFFSYETEPKNGRSIACNLAKANARASIAGEIATFIDKSLASSQEGNAAIDENNPQSQPLREFVSNTLAEKVQALIHGAEVIKTYWEKRQYEQERGATRDFKAYTCAVFVRMDQKRLSRSIDEAANFVANKADDPETKANVKKALKDAATNFAKAKRGVL